MAHEVEQRLEAHRHIPDFQGKTFSDKGVRSGWHRGHVGGKWDEMGQLQLDFLREQGGLLPEHRFVDVACGSLRAGRLLVGYLDPGNYYGVDINHELMEIGYERELDDEARARLPLANLRMTDRFDMDFGVSFDRAIAQSLFTHISMNHIRLCLYRLARVMRPGGVFYATFFERSGQGFPLDTPGRPGSAMYTERDVFWNYRRDLRYLSSFAPWKFEYIGDWGHPRRQKMVSFTRLDEPMPHDERWDA